MLRCPRPSGRQHPGLTTGGVLVREDFARGVARGALVALSTELRVDQRGETQNLRGLVEGFAKQQEQLVRQTGHLSKVGKALEQAAKSHNQSVRSLESRVLVAARKIGELGVPGELPEPAVVATMPDLPASAGEDPAVSLVAGNENAGVVTSAGASAVGRCGRWVEAPSWSFAAFRPQRMGTCVRKCGASKAACFVKPPMLRCNSMAPIGAML